MSNNVSLWCLIFEVIYSLRCKDEFVILMCVFGGLGLFLFEMLIFDDYLVYDVD